jgi:mannose-1-phosphate guanylyltransferase
MKALILAGGYATRLRPLSFSIPKQLFPVVGKPLLYRTLDNLRRVGVDEVILAVNYLADSLRKRVGGEYEGVKITYSKERTPLGTGGPIKKVESSLRGEDFFLCFNGDVLFQNCLEELIQLHERRKPVATITLREVEDPSRFGVAVLDDEMYVRNFVEKPNKGEVDSRYINAGIYAFSSKIFDYIPKGRMVSTETEVFPLLARERRLLGRVHEGSWFDVGKIEDYKNANWFLLKESYRSTKFKGSYKVRPPVYISSQCEIGNGSLIGPNAIVGSKACVGEGSRIEESILFDRVTLGSQTEVKNAVLGEDVELGNNVVIKGDVVLAEGVKVLDGVRVIGRVNVCPHIAVKEDLKGPMDVLCGS